MLTSAPGTGGTSLVSRVAVPAVVGAAVEYGGILQQTNGTVTTLRANALGLGRMFFGVEQFPYCPEIDQGGCSSPSRILRSVSASMSFQDTRKPVPGTTPGPPGATDLLGDDYRTASWGVRIDVTPSNNLDDPKYVTAWKTAIDKLRKDPSSGNLTKAVEDFFSDALEKEVYPAWMEETVKALSKAVGEEQFFQILEGSLVELTSRLSALDPQFGTNVVGLSRAYSNYFDVRDALIREAHVHKLSVEVTNLLPLNQPATWNTRFVYSHQPTLSPTLVTANVSTSWYSNEGPNGERWRDVQIAAQLDRRLNEIPQFGFATASFAVYYQWMKEDALIQIPPGTTAPGSGIELPAEARSLLDTKGHIVVAQGQLAIPMGQNVKVPFSVTWSNRTELVKEKDVRGQVGLTLDLDGFFH
jgi:hypothetical protein